MGRFPSLPKRSSLLWALALPLAAAAAIQVPAGAELHLRLKTKVSTTTSHPKDPVEALVIVPVMANGEFVIPAGATVRGAVDAVKPSTKANERATLDLKFTELDLNGEKLKLDALVTSVDNARESVDATGKVMGIVASETIAGKVDAGIARIAQKYSGLADILSGAKSAVMGQPEADITYEPGVEMRLRLAQPLALAKPGGAGPVARLQPVPDETRLLQLVVGQPFQTMAEKPSKPSDITNLMFVGPEEKLKAAFVAAGWSPAAALDARSAIETVRAISELRGYKEAPVSVLLLDGQPPGLVFEKQNNTFAKRHHLRIWRRPATFQDQPVWVCAATHDTGISFSEENRTFIHKIDSEIDKERSKVVNDLLLTGMVSSLALVDRPAVPKSGENATGDQLVTDGNMAVLILK